MAALAPIKKAAIIGAGQMGLGIACVPLSTLFSFRRGVDLD